MRSSNRPFHRPFHNALALVFLIGAALAACAPVKFSSSPDAQKGACNNSGRACTTSDDGINHFDYTVAAPTSSADVLFVLDNSASMSSIHRSIANRFSSFLYTIDALDYNIGFTTTDVAKNNGALLPLISGGNVLTRNSPNRDAAFTAVIQRPETLVCEQYLQTRDCRQANACSDYSSYCPSEDTRGIYAANLAVQRSESGFLRPNVPLSVIIVSNADERAAGGRVAGTYPMEALDSPSSLVSMVSQTFASTKSLKVHSIIVPPGDGGCLQAQKYSDLIFGWTGEQYAMLSSLTGGRVGSVCAGDYSSQLGDIAGSIAQPPPIDLACTPIAGTFNVALSPADPSANPTLTGNRVTFSKVLAAGTSISLSFDCKAI